MTLPRPNRSSVIIALRALVLFALAACSEKTESFTFTIDRSVQLDDPNVSPDDAAEFFPLVNEHLAPSFVWNDRRLSREYEVKGRSSATVSFQVWANGVEAGGSIATPVQNGSRVCIVSQLQLDECLDGPMEACACDNLMVLDGGGPDGRSDAAPSDDGGILSRDPCRGPDDDTLALYEFEGSPGPGHDSKGAFPAELIAGEATLGRSSNAECGSGALVRETEVTNGGAFLLVSRPTIENGDIGAHQKLREDLLAVEFMIYLENTIESFGTVFAAERDGPQPTQFEIGIEESGTLSVRLTQFGRSDVYCFGGAPIPLKTWTRVGINLRDGDFEAIIDGDRTQPTETGSGCNNGPPEFVPIPAPSAAIEEGTALTIGVSQAVAGGARWLRPGARLDQLRLLKSRL